MSWPFDDTSPQARIVAANAAALAGKAQDEATVLAATTTATAAALTARARQEAMALVATATRIAEHLSSVADGHSALDLIKVQQEAKALTVTAASIATTVTAKGEHDATVLAATASAVAAALAFKAEQEAKMLIATATAANAAFLAMVSHEIRTPMNGVLGMTELLTGTLLSDEQRDYVDTVDRSARSLLRIINDILDFSKLDAGKMLLDHRESFSIRQLFKDAQDIIRPNAQLLRNVVTCTVDPDVPQLVTGDSGRLLQVLINLLGNACKFTKDGLVTMTAKLSAGESCITNTVNTPTSASASSMTSVDNSPASSLVSPASPMSAASESPTGTSTTMTIACPACTDTTPAHGVVGVVFSVVDTGMGIDPTMSDQLFQPFVQGGVNITRTFGGTGLGLAISKKLVEAMGGTIGMESTVGKGSTFRFEIPFRTNRPTSERPSPLMVRLDEPQSLAVQISCSSRDRSPETKHVVDDLCKRPHLLSASRVLVAEDNLVNQKVIGRMLQKLGVKVFDVVANGQATVDAVTARPDHYNLVLMDCHMPIKDGITATREIRTLEKADIHRPRLAIVALTADAVVGAREMYLAQGMDGYLSKPVSQQQLRAALEQFTPMDL
jgi:signal transduction histidine kinase